MLNKRLFQSSKFRAKSGDVKKVTIPYLVIRLGRSEKKSPAFGQAINE